MNTLRFVALGAAALFALACTKELQPIDVKDALVACERISSTSSDVSAAYCNEETIAIAGESGVLASKHSIEDAMIDAAKSASGATAVEKGDGAIAIQRETLKTTTLTFSGGDVADFEGSLVERGDRISLCVSAPPSSIAADPCPRIHTALLRDGAKPIDDAIEAASKLPAIKMPRVPKGCDVDEGARGTFRIECDEAVVDVSWPEDGDDAALKNLAADAQQDAWEDNDPSVEVSTGTCAILGTVAPCISVAGSWTVRGAVVQTQQGRRLVECGVAGAREPTGDLCPRIATTTSTTTISKPATTE